MTSGDRSLREDLTPGEKDALAFQAVVVLGSVPDLLVALVRFARRDRGVQLGPTLTSLVVAAGTTRTARWALRAGGRRGAAARLGLTAAIFLLPLPAGALPPTVVGARNPLWQLAVSAGVRAVSACLTVLPAALAVGRRRRDASLSGA